MKVLFVRTSRHSESSRAPQLGLAFLAAVLKRAGHQVKVLDLLILPTRTDVDFADVVREFEPDVVGFSLYSSTQSLSSALIDRLRAMSDCPVLVGGPHASVSYRLLADDTRIDYILRGEAEGAIVETVENARRQPVPVVVDCPLPDVGELPAPDFTDFIGHQSVYHYPLQTSRGCPYGCKFCTVKVVSSRQWRTRDIGVCLEELRQAKAMFPALRNVSVIDDSPATRREHLKEFLRRYTEADFRLALIIDNIRADHIDAELLELARSSGVKSLCLGVEHGSPEMLAFINKGETIQQIREAARLIKASGLELGLCFIIGLPTDTLERTDLSIRLARELGALYIYWNMAHPFPESEIERWYVESDGVVHNVEDYASYSRPTLKCPDPIVETPDFTGEERKKAYFKAVVMTNTYPFSLRELGYLLGLGWRYGLMGVAFASLLRHPFCAGRLFLFKVRRRLRLG